ncbi:Alpha-monoglucosyldiacylglycerol synthase [Thermoflexales bacterium]|nr:Alpha-monoglucosyldiacylglycerol synthase [Thermoflexales bacterium]
MKIGLITGEYPPQQGGVGDFTRELARALSAAGHEAQVVTSVISHQSSAVSEKQAAEVAVRRVISSWGMRCWGEVAEIAKRQQFEILNIQYEPAAYAMRVGVNFLPSAWARRAIKVPIVTTFHDLLVPYLFPKAGPLRRKVVEYLARHSDAIIVTNDEDRARLSSLQFPISSLHTIPIGSNIDPTKLSEFDRDAERARWGLRPAESLLGYFGFLNLSKGGSDLMQALKTLSASGLPVKLLLIGGRTGSSDPTNAEYAAQVDQLVETLGVKDRVIATGYLGPADVSRALLACDVLVLPYVDGASLRRGSLHAAMAHGRAIVTTEPPQPIGGLQHEESVLYVPPRDPQALATAVQRVLQDEVLRDRLQSSVNQAAKLYTWDRIAAQTLDVFKQVTPSVARKA